MAHPRVATVKHDPLTCPTCAPLVTSAAFRRGEERARQSVADGQPVVLGIPDPAELLRGSR